MVACYVAVEGSKGTHMAVHTFLGGWEMMSAAEHSRALTMTMGLGSSTMKGREERVLGG